MSKVSLNFRLTLAAMLLMSLLLSGCGGPVNMSNYNKITTGMTEQEVESVLGKGEEQASSGVNVPGATIGDVSVPGVSMSGKSVVWKNGTNAISVMFLNGKVMSKAQIGL